MSILLKTPIRQEMVYHKIDLFQLKEFRKGWKTLNWCLRLCQSTHLQKWTSRSTTKNSHKIRSESTATGYWDAQLSVLPESCKSWPFSFPDEWALLPGPTFSGGFIHHSILCLTGSKHFGGAQGIFWCDGYVMVSLPNDLPSISSYSH